MLVDPGQSQPIPAREGERYSAVNKTDAPIRVNDTTLYPRERATFVAQREGRKLVWRKDLPLD